MRKTSVEIINNLKPELLRLIGKIKSDKDDPAIILLQYVVNAASWMPIPISTIVRIEETKESVEKRGEYPIVNVYVRKPRHAQAKLFHDLALTHVETSPRTALVATMAGPKAGCYFDEALGRLRCPPDFS